MRVLFTCGGTGGHINPALSVAELLLKTHPDTQILFVGNKNGMESTLIPKAGYPFEYIEVAGLGRKLTPENIVRNIKAVYLLLKSSPRAREIIKKFAPDVVMGTGGYVSGPVVRMAHKMGIKTITHEQNAYPGVTSKLLAEHVDSILLGARGAADRFGVKDPSKIKFTGNPVRSAFFTADKKAARNRLGVGERFCILSFGGSLGADRVNGSILSLMEWTKDKGNVFHIHATGKGSLDSFKQSMRERGLDPDSAGMDIREYIDNMAICFAAADLIIGRAGASTISEITAASKPSILIPSPNVTENHQFYNASELSEKDAAVLIEEKQLTGETLVLQVNRLMDNPSALMDIGRRAGEMSMRNSAQLIVEEIVSLANAD